MPERVILGVELGGTKTTAILLRADIKEFWIGRGGPSTPNSTAPETASKSLQDAIGSVFRAANLNRETEVDVVVATEGDIQDVRKTTAEYARIGRLDRIHEGEAAHCAAFGPTEGIVVLCGTGSIGWARNARNQIHVASSWGVIGDEGSGYWIGREGLAAAFKAADGRGRETSLVDKILQNRNTKDLRSTVGWFYEPGFTRQRIASFAPLVLAEAEAGDLISRKITAQATSDAADIVEACWNALYAKEAGHVDCVGFGGLFRSELYLVSFSRSLSSAMRRCHQQVGFKVRDDAAVGTIHVGLARAGIAVGPKDEDTLQKLRDQIWAPEGAT